MNFSLHLKRSMFLSYALAARDDLTCVFVFRVVVAPKNRAEPGWVHLVLSVPTALADSRDCKRLISMRAASFIFRRSSCKGKSG
jgi:hypothetical protein